MAYYNGNRNSYRQAHVTKCPCNETAANNSMNNSSNMNNSCNTDNSHNMNNLCNTKSMCNTNSLCSMKDSPVSHHNTACASTGIQEGLAIAYVPWQRFEELFCESKAFMLGTAFPSLFKPFLAGGKCK